MVVEVALHDRPEPPARLRHRLVHAGAKLPFDFQQLRSHPLPDGSTLYGKAPVPVLPADIREAQKVERLRLTLSSPFPVLFGKPPELNPARFLGMEFQSKLPQPLPKILQKTVCFRLVLKTENDIVGITDDDHVPLCALLAPDIHPEIEDVVQIDIGQQRRYDGLNAKDNVGWVGAGTFGKVREVAAAS